MYKSKPVPDIIGIITELPSRSNRWLYGVTPHSTIGGDDFPVFQMGLVQSANIVQMFVRKVCAHDVELQLNDKVRLNYQINLYGALWVIVEKLIDTDS